MKQKYLFFLVFLLILAGCSLDYKPSDYYVPSEDASVDEFFPDSIGIWQGDSKMDWNDDYSTAISASYGDSDVFMQIILLKDKSKIKKVLRDRVMPQLKGIKLKNKYKGFDYYGKTDDRTFLLWKNDEYYYYFNFKNDNMQIVVDSSKFLQWK